MTYCWNSELMEASLHALHCSFFFITSPLPLGGKQQPAGVRREPWGLGAHLVQASGFNGKYSLEPHLRMFVLDAAPSLHFIGAGSSPAQHPKPSL